MNNERIKAYICQRMAELEQEKDLQEIATKGRLSFGIDSARHGRLPAWGELVKQKKKLVKLLWINAAFVSLTVVGMAGGYVDTFDQNWLKSLLIWMGVSAVVMLFNVVWSYYSLFYQFRLAEREVRKLIYQDLLYQLKKEE